MNLLETFGPVWIGAGTRGFAEEGYWFHPPLQLCGLSFRGTTFVSKSLTAHGQAGNAPLTRTWAPKEFFPRCIKAYLFRGIMVNAVKLSGPSIREFLLSMRWQRIKKPFFISLAVTADDAAEQIVEAKICVAALRSALQRHRGPQIGIQLNPSCPNVQTGVSLEDTAELLLTELGKLGLPIVVKLNVLTPPEVAAAIAKHPACSGISISQSIPFGTALSESWWWENFPNGSPMRERGFAEDGALSGAPLHTHVVYWVREFRRIDGNTHLNAGGGIMHVEDVGRLCWAGANSVSISSVVVLRPRRVQSIVHQAHKLFCK